jgi:hypothetical protein
MYALTLNAESAQVKTARGLKNIVSLYDEEVEAGVKLFSPLGDSYILAEQLQGVALIGCNRAAEAFCLSFRPAPPSG